ncbi:phosphosulfolactate synthase [Microbacterium sp.]|uniref:phosphosulfolactate synthase n=1 Tax=Microbacterium sp. TaxID=51671 RepID=UPI0031FE6350|nr:phosphosulfolactate synthase [Microbacterium sp.]
MPRTFEFLEIPERPPKPRTTGLTTTADIGAPNSFVEGVLELWHEVIDAVKVSAFNLTADDKAVREKIALYRKWGIDAQIGGPILELARIQGKERETLERMKDMGYTSLEISAEALPNQHTKEEEAEFAALAREFGFLLHGEVGKKFADGDRLRHSEHELNIEAAANEIQMYLDVGCDFVYFEGHLLRAIIGDSAEYADERGHQIVEMAERVGVDKIVWEVPFTYLSYAQKRILQHWLVSAFGPDVNVGNVMIDEIPELEVIRCGMFPVFGAKGGDHPFLVKSANSGGGVPAEWWKIAEPVS